MDQQHFISLCIWDQTKLETVQYLIEKKASRMFTFKIRVDRLLLFLLCKMKTAIRNVVRYLLEEAGVDVNRQIYSKTTMWKNHCATARFAVNSKMTQSKLQKSGREWWVDCSALCCKTRRHGDCGVVVGTWCEAFNQERSWKRRTLVSIFFRVISQILILSNTSLQTLN